ncbi:MAG: ATP-binding protein, partial [Beijerinckiaceae bacterium]
SVLLRKTSQARKSLRILILDPHNEYSAAFPDTSVTIDSGSLDLPFWLFRFEEFVDVLFRGRKQVEEECDILRELITLAKAKYRSNSTHEVTSSLLKRPISISGGNNSGGNSSEAPSPYRMLDLFGLIDEILGQLEPRFSRVHLRALRVRLDALQNDPRYRFMFNSAMGADNPEPIISHLFRIPDHGRPITVFQLASLPSEVINAVASVLSRMAFDLAMYSNGQFEILVVCEEAHRYVPENQALGFAPTRAAIAKIAKEGRKYGCYLAIVTQRPGELDPTILSQCSTVFSMRLSNERDQGIIRAAIGDASASTISFLSAIGNREAIVFGEGVSTTMRMRFETQPRHLLPSAHGLTAGTNWTNGQAAREITVRDILARMRSNGGEAYGQ